MRFAVVGATGRVGSRLCRGLREAGHEVRALTRGGPVATALNKIGVEVRVGTFEHEDATGSLDDFFEHVDAAFVMVRTDWTEPDHYAKVTERIVAALRRHEVGHVVSLSSVGAELAEGAGHSTDFYELETGLNALSSTQVTHLRCAWFMDNYSRIAVSAAEHQRFAGMLRPDLKVPLIATRDIAPVAERMLLAPPAEHRLVVEVHGSEDLTILEIAEKISVRIGREVEYFFIPTDRDDVRAIFLEQFGTSEIWRHRVEMYDAFNSGRARYHQPRSIENSTPTSFDEFLDEAWMPVYKDALVGRVTIPESFESNLSARLGILQSL